MKNVALRLLVSLILYSFAVGCTGTNNVKPIGHIDHDELQTTFDRVLKAQTLSAIELDAADKVAERVFSRANECGIQYLYFRYAGGTEDENFLTLRILDKLHHVVPLRVIEDWLQSADTDLEIGGLITRLVNQHGYTREEARVLARRLAPKHWNQKK